MTDLFIMRHGEAEEFSQTRLQQDHERALTARGQQQAQAVGHFLSHKIKTLDWAIVSPYVRAQETFAAINQQLAVEVIEQSEAVTPMGQAATFGSELLARLQIEPAESVLVVAHMPFVGRLLAYLAPGELAPMFTPAGVAHVKLSPLAMQGQLIAYYPIQALLNESA